MGSCEGKKENSHVPSVSRQRREDVGDSYEYSDFLEDSPPKLFLKHELFCPALE